METLPAFRVLRPQSVADAVAAYAAAGRVRLLAGGTDLIANMRSGLVEADALIDLGAIAELRRLELNTDGLVIGAGVRLEELANHPAIVRDYGALAQAAQSVAGPTHRVVATVGGNLCLDTRCRFYNQSEPWRAGNQYCLKIGGGICKVAPKADRCYAAYSGDLAPAFMVHSAVVEIAGPKGRREEVLGDIYTDDGKAFLRLAPDEILVALRVPAARGWRSGYEKIRVRGALDFPLTGVAVALRREEGRIAELRIATTATESQPVLMRGLEALHGATFDQAIAQLEKLIRKQFGMMETHLLTAAYRRRVTPVLAKRLLQRLLAD